MSKAAQRRLADRQRRQREQGLADPRVLDRVLDDPYLARDPVQLWRAVDMSARAEKPHPDDVDLRAFQRSCRPLLSALATAQTSIGDEGVSFPSFLVYSKHDEDIFTPMSLVGRSEADTSDLFSLLERRLQALDVDDHLLLCLAAPMFQDHLVCLGISRGGARLVWAFLDGQWYAARHSARFASILSRGLDLDDSTEEGQAFDLLLDFVRSRAPSLVDSDSKLDAFSDAVRAAFDLAQQPFLDMTVNAADAHSEALEYADDVEAFADMQAKEIKARQKDVQRRLRAQEVRSRGNAPLVQRAAPAAAPPQPAAACGPQAKVHASLEERLSAFF